MKKGKAFIWTVAIKCPCGGDCVDENGSMSVVWDSEAPVTCIDCGEKCVRPKTAK